MLDVAHSFSQGQIHTSPGALPVEILAHIFSLGPQDGANIKFLVNVSHVSTYWRAAVLGASYLWWNVHVAPQMTDRATTWLKRSRNAPVRFCIWLRNLPENQGLPVPAYLRHIEAMMDIVVMHMSRCKSLILDRLQRIYAPFVYQRLRGVQAPILQSCSFGPLLVKPFPQFGDSLEHTDFPLSHLPMLRRLEFRNEQISTQPPLFNLSTLRYVPGAAPHLSAHQVLVVLRDCPSLVNVEIQWITADPTRDLHRVIVHRSSRDSVVVLPRLKSMLLDVDRLEAAAHIVKRISIPSIEHLALHVSRTLHGVPDEDDIFRPSNFHDSVFPTLKGLEVDWFPGHFVECLLRKSPVLETFVMRQNPGSAALPIIDILIPQAAPICPLLKSIYLFDCAQLTVHDIMCLVNAYASIKPPSNEVIFKDLSVFGLKWTGKVVGDEELVAVTPESLERINRCADKVVLDERIPNREAWRKRPLFIVPNPFDHMQLPFLA